ncbi:MAG: MFS transporter [Trueperaceae bacterium]|nr:MFS transporter [Trueperaceae bacterium]
MAGSPQSLPTSTTLTRRDKLGYGVGELGASLSYNAVNLFWLFFLVEVAGLEPSLAGWALVLGRVVDAVTDPLMGALYDRLRSRVAAWQYLFWGALPFGVSFALLWWLPFASPLLSFVVAAALLPVHTVIFTAVQVPYLALTPLLAPGYDERTSLSSYRVAFGTVASLFAAALPPVLAALFRGWFGGTGWFGVGVVFGAVASLAYLSTAWSLRRTVRGGGFADAGFADDSSANDNRADNHADNRLADDAALLTVGRPGVASLFRVRGYPQMLALFVTVTLGLGVLSSMLPFFLATRGLGPTTQTLTLGGLFVTAVLVLPLWTRVARWGGKARAFTIGLLLISAGLLLILTVPTGSVSPPLVLVTLLVGAGLATVLLFPWALLPDLVEVDALQHGTRREGLLYAVFTFAQKTAFAVGAWLNAQVLGLVGYQPGGAEQSPTAVLGVLLMVGPGAALLFAVAALLAWRYPHRRNDHRAAQQTLARRSDPATRR